MQTLIVRDSERMLSEPTALSPKGEKSIADASQLERVWNDHINTIQFGDYTSKATKPSVYHQPTQKSRIASAHSRARSKRLNQDNLTALSQSNADIMSLRNSQAILNEDLKSNLLSKEIGRNEKRSRVQTAITRNVDTLNKSKMSKVLSFDALSNGTRNKSFHQTTLNNLNEGNFLK